MSNFILFLIENEEEMYAFEENQWNSRFRPFRNVRMQYALLYEYLKSLVVLACCNSRCDCVMNCHCICYHIDYDI